MLSSLDERQVLKAQNIKNGQYHAIKCMKNQFDSIDQVRRLSLASSFELCAFR